MTIVYTSETGYTANYAKHLAKHCNLPLLPLAEAQEKLEAKSPIIYLGWIMAGKVVGLKEARKKFTIKAVCGVGIRPDVDNMTKTIRRMRGVPKEGGFYCQGGYAPDKLSPNKRKSLTMVLGILGKKIRSKNSITSEEKKLLQVFDKGGSFVDKNQLVHLINYIKTL